MSWDPLLFWMTHVGEASWTTFRNAVARGVTDSDDAADAARSLRNSLSDLGHADFFVGDSQRWRVNPPVLAELESPPGSALLVGARTPQMIETVIAAATEIGCDANAVPALDSPSAIRLSGSREAFSRVAAAAAIRFVPELSRKLIGSFDSIQDVFSRAPTESAPTNWRVRSLDFSSMKWIDRLLPNSACEYYPRQGRARWYVHTRHGHLHPLRKREAIFAAAMIRRIPLIRHDASQNRLVCAPQAALPDRLARAASLCSGARGHFEDGKVVFDGVNPAVATLLCVAAGQACPPIANLRPQFVS